MNYKVLLTVFICVCNSVVALPFDAPKYQGFITDPGHILDLSQKQKLETLSQQIQLKTGAQVATAIVPEMGESWTIDEYANRLFEAWGIGQKGEDNGILFLIAIKEKKMRIEVGYGLEHIIPDGKA
ncbi:MAG: TPM domain-containing protein, partial [Candidatus Margulisbacteria bacterium]|nr:TPM domain-containing protein [Candidatus Margulisiibacteriota bacterium]